MLALPPRDAAWMSGIVAVCIVAPAWWWIATRRSRRAFAWSVGLSGYLAPWATGVAVKGYLDALGRPTYPWRAFLHPRTVAAELLLALYMAAPMVLLALLSPWLAEQTARVGLHTRAAQRLPLRYAAWGGVAATCWIYLPIFWEFDAMVLLWPWCVYTLPAMVLGAVVGWAAGRRITAPPAPTPPSDPR